MKTLTAARSALIAFFLAAVTGVPALAAQAEKIEFARSTVAKLKVASFGALRDLHAMELQADYPAHKRVSLYVGVPVGNFRLQQVTVSFDGGPATGRSYTPREVRALERGHLHRVTRTNLAPGKHRVTLQYHGLLLRNLLEDKPVSGRISLEFDKGEAPRRLIIPVMPDVFGASWLGDPEDWVAAQQNKDPRLAMTRFLRATGKPYEALINLLEMAGPRDTSQVLPLAYDLELAHSYVDFGMREQADQAMRTAFDTGVDVSLLADVWLRIAELDLQRGDLTRAYTLLQYLENDLTPAQLVRWQDSMSRLLMSEGQFEQARAVLERGDNAMEVLTDVNLPTNQTPYMRFNYAVALLKTGETDRGRTLLERIGRVTAFDEAQRALRDKANLLLGYNFLEAEQGATGKNILERIRLDGPYSNEALLALGWAELAPHGTRQPRALVGDEPELGDYGTRNREDGRIIKQDAPVRLRDDPFSRIQLGPFRMAEMAETKRQARQRSLVAWTEVAGNSPQDPAVQEALIAVPYVVYALGWPDRALQHYLQAIELLEQARAELSGYASASTIDLGAIARGDLSQLPDTPWMLQFLAENPFNEYYQNYLDLNRIRTDLQRLAVHGSHGLSLHLSPRGEQQDLAQGQRLGKLREALQHSADVQARLAQQAIADEIQRQLEGLDQYLIAARLGVARFQERVQAQAAVKPEAEAEAPE